MPASFFADVLAARVSLTQGERTALSVLEERPRDVRRGAILHRQNEPSGDLYILRKGLMMSYLLLDDGSRQILRFHFPGDMIGVPGMIYHDTPEAVAALTDSEVCPFEKAALGRLFIDHPRIAALILALNQIERVTLSDRLAALGRTSAKMRVAGLILDMRNRLREYDAASAEGFPLVLTQEEIGDAIGLTAVHVNRMLRQIEDDGLIRRENGHLTIRDEHALARAAHYVDRYARLDLSWLPEGR